MKKCMLDVRIKKNNLSRIYVLKCSKGLNPYRTMSPIEQQK